MMEITLEEATVIAAFIEGLEEYLEDPNKQMAALCLMFDHVVKNSGCSLPDALECFVNSIWAVNAELGNEGVM